MTNLNLSELMDNFTKYENAIILIKALNDDFDEEGYNIKFGVLSEYF